MLNVMKTLIAEDDAVTRRMLEATLTKWGYTVVMATDGQEAWRILQQEDPPRLAVLDWMMPEMSGLEICRLIRQRPTAAYIYLILLTVMSQKENIIAGMEAGADDYIVKPFEAQELKMRLRAGQRIIDLQDSLLTVQKKLQHEASHDLLTDLWNHATIMGILDQECNRAARSGQAVGVMMADLDNFKQINDTHGHLVGDRVLREVSARLRGSIRSYDAAGRYGGEEFLVVLPDCRQPAAAVQTAEDICHRIAGQPIVAPTGPLTVTISVGLAIGRLPAVLQPEMLINAADQALYQAKRQGKNQVVLAAAS